MHLHKDESLVLKKVTNNFYGYDRDVVCYYHTLLVPSIKVYISMSGNDISKRIINLFL